MRPWSGCEWEEEVEEGCPGTHVPDMTKIPEFTRSLETIRGAASKCDPPSCRSDLSGESTKDKDETCKGEQEHGKMPTALSPEEGVE